MGGGEYGLGFEFGRGGGNCDIRYALWVLVAETTGIIPMPQPAFAEHVAHINALIGAALDAADPYKALVRVWTDLGSAGGGMRTVLPKDTPCVLVSAGKASVAMARAAVEACGVKPAVGVIVVPAGSACPPSLSAAGGGASGLRFMEADHPLPSQRNLIAAQAVLDAARIASSRALPLVVLLSGGASAHLTFPERGMTLSDVRITTDALLRSGATIREINTVRKHVERLKGGNLARAASPLPVFTFILSDVPGEPPPLDVIASGPTAADPTTFKDALAVLERRAIPIPAPMLDHLRAGIKGQRTETLKPGDRVCENIHNHVIGSSSLAVAAAAEAARGLGFHIAEARLNVEGEARAVGEDFATRALALRQSSSRAQAIIWGGETTVTHRSIRPPADGVSSVRSQGAPLSAFGGRNQELALAAAVRIGDQQNIALAAFATDGIDGVAPPGEKPAAGALVTGRTAAAARDAAPPIDLRAALDAHDSYAALKKLRAQFTIGPTGTNVNDLLIALTY